MSDSVIRRVRRAIKDSVNSGGMKAGMPKVTIDAGDASRLCLLSEKLLMENDQLTTAQAEIEALRQQLEQEQARVAELKQAARVEGEPVDGYHVRAGGFYTSGAICNDCGQFYKTRPGACGCGNDESINGFESAAIVLASEILGVNRAHPPAKVPEWIKCSERLPTEADADFEHRLWCWFPVRKDMKLLLLDQVLQAALSYDVEWMPTGLKRPNPPQTEGE